MIGRSDRSRPIWAKTATGVTTTPVAIYIPEDAVTVRVVPSARCYVGIGRDYTPPAVSSTNGVTTITTAGTPTGGTFKLTMFPGTSESFETAALTYNESAADIKTALIAGSAYAVTGDITAAGGALPTAVTLTWTGVYAGTVPPIIASSVALTGGTNPSIRVYTSTVPDGNGGYGYAETTGITFEREPGRAEERYVYVAAISSTVDYFLTAYA